MTAGNNELKQVAIGSLLLNPKNYRHAPRETQEECFAALMETSGERDYQLSLAQDIVAHGLDPSQLMIVEAGKGGYFVLEGNRRLAALKALANPAVIPDLPGMTEFDVTAYRRKFENAASGADLPTKVLCVISTDRDDANHWISLKHTNVGDHKGAGTVGWGPEQKARYATATSGAGGQGGSDKQAHRAVQLLDTLDSLFRLDEEMEELITSARQGGLTTLGRLLNHADNRARLGLNFTDTGLVITVSDEAARRVFVRILTDMRDRVISSRTLNTAADVLEYLATIEEDLPAQDEIGDDDNAGDSGADQEDEEKPKRRKKAARPPAKKPFQSLTLRHANEKTKEILSELRRLTYKDHPYTIAILTRVLLDLYSADVLVAMKPDDGKPLTERLNKVADNQTLAKRVRACLNLLEPNNTPARKRQFPRINDALSSTSGDLSVDSMHFYVHRSDYKSNPDTARHRCEEYEPFLKALETHLDEHAADA